MPNFRPFNSLKYDLDGRSRNLFPLSPVVLLLLRAYPEMIRRVFSGVKRLGLGIGSRGRRVVPVVGA